MFHRILLPVDGSLSMVRLVRQAVQFAASVSATVIAMHALSRGVGKADDHAAMPAEDVLAEQRGQQILREVAISAGQAGLACETMLIREDEAWRAILQAAADSNSDLICMLPHGRPRACEPFIGSQTIRVLEHARLPVLLFR